LALSGDLDLQQNDSDDNAVVSIEEPLLAHQRAVLDEMRERRREERGEWRGKQEEAVTAK
jgi:hypothetical protein